MIQLVFEASVLEFKRLRVFLISCISWDQSTFLIFRNNSSALIDNGPNSQTFIEDKTPSGDWCLGKNVALRLHFMSWPILWPFTCESSWDPTMNTIWLWRVETLTCLKCYVMTSCKTLFSISIVLKMIAEEISVLP